MEIITLESLLDTVLAQYPPIVNKRLSREIIHEIWVEYGNEFFELFIIELEKRGFTI